MFTIQRRSTRRANIGEDVNEFVFDLNCYYKNIERIPRNISDTRAFNKKYIEVYTKPFKAFKLKNFFKVSTAKAIQKEVLNIDYEFRKNDLFSLHQSRDLSSFPCRSPMFSIRQYFDKEIRRVLEALFKKRLDGVLSLSVSKYTNKCHLLCHDDMYSNRQVAFIYYITSSWDPKYGGSFDMFTQDKHKRPSVVKEMIFPEFNTFLSFEVSPCSHHQVSEVVSKDKIRYAISGWYHSTEANRPRYLNPHLILPSEENYCSPVVSVNPDLNTFVEGGTNQYLENQKQIAKKFIEDGVIMLNDFINRELFDDIAIELRESDRIRWKKRGPPNLRNVEVAEICQNENNVVGLVDGCPALSAYLDTAMSSEYGMFLYHVLGFEFEGEISVEVEVEINRWSWKNYTLACQDSRDDYEQSIEVWTFFNTNNITEAFEDGLTAVIYNFNNFDQFIAPGDNNLIVINRPPHKESTYFKYLNNEFKDSVFYSIRMCYFALKKA